MEPLKKTVTMQVEVSPRIADLVYFARSLADRGLANEVFRLSDEELIGIAESFWDSQHGED